MCGFVLGEISVEAEGKVARHVEGCSRCDTVILELEEHRVTVEHFEAELLRRTVAQRRGSAGLEPGREDLIVGGTMILRGLMETFRWDTCLVSTRGLREGIVLALAAQMRKE